MGEVPLELKKYRHLLTTAVLLCTAFAQDSLPTTEPTESSTLICYGYAYDDQIGNDFITCGSFTLNVTITACETEYQDELEFAIANELYDDCRRPHCVYFGYNLAFRWMSGQNFLCYSEKFNTGDERQCWERSYNTFYVSGDLDTALSEICFDTAVPSYPPTPSPTQWCDGIEYTDTLGNDFQACGSQTINELALETCDEDSQDELYFGIANRLYTNCTSPNCVYASLDYALHWNSSDLCYETVLNDGSQTECWEDNSNTFWGSGNLRAVLEVICFDTPAPSYTPTLYPTDTIAPSFSPTLDPTSVPTLTPSLKPTAYPTGPTYMPTESPTPDPTTAAPTNTPSAYPTQRPTTTSAPTESPTSVPTQSPSLIPTQSPTPSPSLIPTQSPTSIPTQSPVPTTSPTLIPTQNPTTLTPTQSPVPTVSPTLIPTVSPTLIPTQSPTLIPTQSPTLIPTESPTLIPTQSPTSVPTTTKNSNASVLVSAKISGINETQIEDTVAPLGRVIDVDEWKISIGTYSEVTLNVAGRRRLEAVGFLIHYIVQVLKEDEAKELTNFITAGGITSQFAQELETEFNNPGVNITVESIIAIQMTGVTESKTKTLGLEGWIFGLFFFILCMLLAAIMFYIVRRYKKLLKSQPRDQDEVEITQTGRDDYAGKIDNKAGSTDVPTPMTRGTTIDLTNLEQTSNTAGAEDSQDAQMPEMDSRGIKL